MLISPVNVIVMSNGCVSTVVSSCVETSLVSNTSLLLTLDDFPHPDINNTLIMTAIITADFFFKAFFTMLFLII